MPEWYKPKAQVDEERREAEAQRVRRERDRLLAETDYPMLADSPVKDSAKWRAYRQALRDIPQQKDGFPFEVKWPTKPGGEK